MLKRFDTTTKIVLITFFSRLYFYIHVNALYLQGRGLNLAAINSLGSIIIASIFLAEVPTGVLADRIGRKWSVVMALLLQTLGEVLYLFGDSYPAFAFIAVIAGVGFAFSSGATESLVYESLPPGDRETAMKRAMGSVGTARFLGFFLAPLLGGLIVTELVMDRFLLVIGMTAVSVFVALLISLTLHEPRRAAAAEETPGALTIFREGLAEMRGSRPLRMMTLLAVFTATFGDSLLSFSQPHLVAYGVSNLLIGVVLSAGALLGALLQRNVTRLEGAMGKRWGLLTAALLPGFLYLLLSAADSGPAIFLLVMLLHATQDLRLPLFSAYQNELIAGGSGGHSRATILSLINMLGSLYVAVMSLIFGVLATISIPLAFLALGVHVVAAGIILRVDRLPGIVAATKAR